MSPEVSPSVPPTVIKSLEPLLTSNWIDPPLRVKLLLKVSAPLLVEVDPEPGATTPVGFVTLTFP